MSHRDSVGTVPAGFAVAGLDADHRDRGDGGRRAQAVRDAVPSRGGAHAARAATCSSTSCYDIAGIPPTWTMVNIIDETVEAVRAQVGDAKVICGLSGGVDSSVVAALLHRAIGDQLTCVFVDHGMLRLDEGEEVVQVFRDQFHVDLVHVQARTRYLALLAGVTDPSVKRHIIGEEFWKVFFEEATRLEGVRFLAQGTLYPDVIESGSQDGGQDQEPPQPHPVPGRRALRAHRAAAPPVQGRGARRRRRAGPARPHRAPAAVPRPGPRGAHHRRDHAREARDPAPRRRDRARGDRRAGTTDREVWQYFAVLPDIRSVGVMGDERTYAHPIIIRAVSSADAMTADWARLPHELLAHMSQPHHQRGRRASTASPTTSRASRPAPSSGSDRHD